MDKETFDFKAMSDATVEFNRKLAANVAEVSARTWKDVVNFGEAVTAINANLVKQYTPENFAEDFSEQLTKFNSNIVRAQSVFTQFFKNFVK